MNGLNPAFLKDIAKIQGRKTEEDAALGAAMKEAGLEHKRYLKDEKLKRRTGNTKKKDGGGNKRKI